MIAIGLVERETEWPVELLIAARGFCIITSFLQHDFLEAFGFDRLPELYKAQFFTK
jgi:hypothetical protein